MKHDVSSRFFREICGMRNQSYIMSFTHISITLLLDSHVVIYYSTDCALKVEFVLNQILISEVFWVRFPGRVVFSTSIWRSAKKVSSLSLQISFFFSFVTQPFVVLFMSTIECNSWTPSRGGRLKLCPVSPLAVMASFSLCLPVKPFGKPINTLDFQSCCLTPLTVSEENLKMKGQGAEALFAFVS